MAVELRCPECRARLRLPSAPDEGAEVECPECGAVFPAPGPDDAAERPRKKRPAADEDDRDEDRPKKKKKKPDEKKPDEKKPAAGPPPSKKRKAKKKETNKALLVGLSVGAVMFLGLVITLLVWFFGRQPPAFEMMHYLPEDCDSASGLNLNHTMKYPEFHKQLEGSYQDTAFKRVNDVVAKALGADPAQLLDYMVTGSGKSGAAVVLKTKAEFDPAGLAKLPGAKKEAAAGTTYYTTDPIDRVSAGRLRAFAPTNRLVVVCHDTIPDAVFKKMLTGNQDNRENDTVARVGPLGKRTVRGTFWAITLFDTKNRPPLDTSTKEGNDFGKMIGSAVASAKGFGFKASLGSRNVRFEVILWYGDKDKPGELYQKFKESPLSKGDDAEPPKAWKEFANGLGNRKIGEELLSNLGATTSGETFVLYSACDTKVIMTSVSGLAGKMVGPGEGGAGPGAGMP